MDPDVYSFAVVAAVIVASIASMAAIFVGTRIALQRTRPREISSVDDDRFARLEQAIDTMAVEIERMSEAQRFTAKLLSDRSQTPSPTDQR